jgi:WG containing repeat
MNLTCCRQIMRVSLLLLWVAGAPRCHAGQDQTVGKGSSETGSIVIQPQFESAGPFSEGVAAVQTGKDEGGKWGYIDKSGGFVINPQFDYAEAFSEGLAAVRSGDEKTGKWGFIDRSGKFVITPRWDHASRFSRGLSIVRNGDIVTGKERIIDRQGNYVSGLEAGVMLPCENGMTLVGMNVSWDDRGVNRQFGFVDKSGKYVIDAKFDDAFCFSEGTAAVRIGDAERGLWGFIDTTGKFVLDRQWGFAYAFKDGTASVATAGGLTRKWGVIDRTGQTVIPLEFPELLRFHDGLALESVTTHKWVTDQQGRTRVDSETNYGFVDKNGMWSMGLLWRSAFAFSQGLAAVMAGEFPNGKWGYIDPKGKYVVEPQYRDARPFSEGMAAVLIDDQKTGKWGYIAR